MFIMSKNQFDLITFGEIMLRLSPPRHERITDGDIFEKRAGGAELNVASGVALLGLRTGIISKLPANKLGTFLKNRIRFVGVSDDYLIYDESPEARLGGGNKPCRRTLPVKAFSVYRLHRSIWSSIILMTIVICPTRRFTWRWKVVSSAR